MPDDGGLRRTLAGLLGLAAAAFVAVCIAKVPMTYLVWADRDLFRASRMFEEGITVGAELSYGTGAQVPGGAYYLLLRALQTLSEDPISVARGLLVLEALGLGALGWAASRLGGLWAGALAVVLYLGLPLRTIAVLQLWNPAMVPPLTAMAVAVLVVAVPQQRAGPFLAFGVLVGLGAHGHLSIGVWAGLTLATLAVTSPRLALRAVPLALLGAALTYVPHLIDEARTGWVNTSAMLFQPHLTQGYRPAMPGQAAEVVPLFFSRAPGQGVASTTPVLAVLGLLPPAGFLVGLVSATMALLDPGEPAPPPEARVLVVLGVPVLLGGLYFMSDPYISPEPRYYIPLAGAFAVVAGVGVARALEGLRADHGGVAGLLSIAVTAWALVPLAPVVDVLQDQTGGTWRLHADTLELLRGELGGAAEAVGRLVVTEFDDQGAPLWRAYEGRDDWLRRHGETFAGSRPPPCWLLALGTTADDTPSAELVAHAIAVEPGTVQVQSVRQVGAAAQLISYVPQLSRCPTALSDRYLDTPVEQQLRKVWAEGSDEGVHTLPTDDPHTTLWAFVTRSEASRAVSTTQVIGIEVQHTGDRVEVTLHGNQLRGASHLGGWHVVGMIEAPSLWLVSSERAEQIVLHDGIVGRHRALTPLSVTAEVPPGDWTVELAFTPIFAPIGDPRPDAPLTREVRRRVPLGPLPP